MQKYLEMLGGGDVISKLGLAVAKYSGNLWMRLMLIRSEAASLAPLEVGLVECGDRLLIQVLGDLPHFRVGGFSAWAQAHEPKQMRTNQTEQPAEQKARGT
ncbi:MAG: hypothetical protein AAF580_16025 [Pseudomonadota bacterium]